MSFLGGNSDGAWGGLASSSQAASSKPKVPRKRFGLAAMDDDDEDLFKDLVVDDDLDAPEAPAADEAAGKAPAALVLVAPAPDADEDASATPKANLGALGKPQLGKPPLPPKKAALREEAAGAAQDPFPDLSPPEPTCMVGSKPVPEGLMPDMQESASAEEQPASDDVASAEDAAMEQSVDEGNGSRVEDSQQVSDVSDVIEVVGQAPMEAEQQAVGPAAAAPAAAAEVEPMQEEEKAPAQLHPGPASQLPAMQLPAIQLPAAQPRLSTPAQQLIPAAGIKAAAMLAFQGPAAPSALQSTPAAPPLRALPKSLLGNQPTGRSTESPLGQAPVLRPGAAAAAKAPMPKPPAMGLVRKAVAQGSGAGLPRGGGADGGGGSSSYMRSNAAAPRANIGPESKAATPVPFTPGIDGSAAGVAGAPASLGLDDPLLKMEFNTAFLSDHAERTALSGQLLNSMAPIAQERVLDIDNMSASMERLRRQLQALQVATLMAATSTALMDDPLKAARLEALKRKADEAFALRMQFVAPIFLECEKVEETVDSMDWFSAREELREEEAAAAVAAAVTQQAFASVLALSA